MLRATLRRQHSGSAGAGTSRQWMQRQSQDAFVAEARRQGYIARSAFKLTHLDDRYGLFQRGTTRAVVDLGCSPGGWCQVIRQRCGDGCAIFGVDLLPVKASVPNAVYLTGDFTSPALQETLLTKLDDRALLPAASGDAGSQGKIDVITSDMCPNRMGGTQDRQRIASLNQQALAFALPLLRPGGHFVCKVLGSKPSYEELHRRLSLAFLTVHACKPPASRQSSDEAFLVGLSKLTTPRRGAIDGQGRRTMLYGAADGGGRYGLDDWPGMARRPHNTPRRGRTHSRHEGAHHQPPRATRGSSAAGHQARRQPR